MVIEASTIGMPLRSDFQAQLTWNALPPQLRNIYPEGHKPSQATFIFAPPV